MLSLKVNPTETEHILSLYYHDEHFDVITKDNAFLSHSFYCTKCDRAYKARPHVCETRKCTQCKDFCEPSSEVIKCEFCLRYFKGKDCYDHHRQYADDTSLSTFQSVKWKKWKVEKVSSGKSVKCVIRTFQKICKKNTFVSSPNAKTAMILWIFTLTNATFSKLN